MKPRRRRGRMIWLLVAWNGCDDVDRYYVVLGTASELEHLPIHDAIVARVAVEVSGPTTFPLWIAESAMRLPSGLGWPNAGFLAATGDLVLVRAYARAWGDHLSQMGFLGVWGQRDGSLSPDQWPWVGPALSLAVANGLRDAGLRVAQYAADRCGWEVDQLGWVPEGPSSESLVSVVTAAQWLGSREVEVPRRVLPTLPPVRALSVLEEDLAEAAITLIDDPLVLPLEGTESVAVDDPEGLGVRQAMEGRWGAVFDAGAATSQPADVMIWVDGLGKPPQPGQKLVAVACRHPEFLTRVPSTAAKVLVYDARPLVWIKLVAKLQGESPWKGRMPFELVGRPEQTMHTSHYATEQAMPNPRLRWLEDQPLSEAVVAFLEEEARALKRLVTIEAQLVPVIEAVAQAWSQGHRLFYVGAGSAGRAGMLDSAEIPPTFGVGPDLAMAILAGGTDALRRAKEGVEDDGEQAARDVRNAGVSLGDVLLAITAHGDTPYTLGAVREARRAGAWTVGLVNNRGTQMVQVADHVVEMPTGPEVLVGSTRLKAGTSEKVVLNLISTLAMVRWGKTYDNLMTDFVSTNKKLKERALRVFTMATGQPRTMALKRLEECEGNLRVAILCALMGADAKKAQEWLARYGSIGRALRAAGIVPSGGARS